MDEVVSKNSLESIKNWFLFPFHASPLMILTRLYFMFAAVTCLVELMETSHQDSFFLFEK